MKEELFVKMYLVVKFDEKRFKTGLVIGVTDVKEKAEKYMDAYRKMQPEYKFYIAEVDKITDRLINFIDRASK